MEFKNVYFVGIGGIGMSAIARYFLHEGKMVAGYDRTETPLTRALAEEGAQVHYDDAVELVPGPFRDPTTTLVVYTPAIPAEHAEFNWFKNHGFEVVKRSQILGHISEGKYVMAVSGTHGKTTTSTLVAWLNHEASAPGTAAIDRENAASVKAAFDNAWGAGASGARARGMMFGAEWEGGTGSAFLGGISKNFDSNLVLGTGRRLAVEADEFDRSFLRLYPDVAVVTSADADHLDIYGTHEAVKEAFTQFLRQIKPGGAAIVKLGVDIKSDNDEIRVYRYSYDQPCDFYAKNITLLEGGYYRFDIMCPCYAIEGCTLGIPGWVNVENAVAAVALMWVAGFDEAKLKKALATYKGVKRRFEFYVNTPRQVYMDDYAHHPRELEATITSVRKMFPGRRITAVFQPHLYTRTRDLYHEFAAALSLADEVVLLPIYPARELPIDGVDAELIGREITAPWHIVEKEAVAGELGGMDTDVVITFGAGNIENYCAEIAGVLDGKS